MTAKSERAAMVRLIDTFGADVLVNLVPPPTMSRGDRVRARAAATNAALNCDSCGLCDHRRPKDEIGPRYAEASLTATTSLIVVTEFPSDAHHRKLIRGALAMSEMVDVDRLAHVSIVGCRPRTADGTLRRPSKIERHACEANFRRAMHAAECPIVLLIGAGAVSAWNPKVTIEQMRGIVGLWDSRWMVAAVESPDVVNRREGATVKEWMQSVGAAVHLLHADTVAGIGATCIDKKCTEPIYAWDNQALPWCAKHIEVKAIARPRDYIDQRLPWGEGETA